MGGAGLYLSYLRRLERREDGKPEATLEIQQGPVLDKLKQDQDTAC